MCVIQVCISRQPPLSPYYLHVFPILRNCLAPPHVREFLHRAFIPQCIYSPHFSLYLFVISICVYSCCLLPWNLRSVLFLFPVPDICFLLFGPVLLTVVLLICYLSICTPPPLAFSLVCELLFVIVICLSDFPVLTLFCVLADYSLCLTFCTSCYLITWLLTSAFVLTTISALS